MPQSGQVFGVVAETGTGVFFRLPTENAEAAPTRGKLGTTADVKVEPAAAGFGASPTAPEADVDETRGLPALCVVATTGKLGNAVDVKPEVVEVELGL